MLGFAQTAVVFFLPFMVRSDSRATESPCRDYGFEKRVFPTTIYQFQGTQVVVVQRLNLTEDACKRSCLADSQCGGLFHDSRSSRGRGSRNGLCVLVPRTTLDKESGSNASAQDSPPVGVKSFAKVCRVAGKGNEKPEQEEEGLVSTQVNNVLYIYGGVTICLGTLMTVLAAFLFRKSPARQDKGKRDPNSKVTLDINMKDFFSKDQEKSERKKFRRLSEGTASSSSIVSRLFSRQNRRSSKENKSGASVDSLTSTTSEPESTLDSLSASTDLDAAAASNSMSHSIHDHSPTPDQVGAFVALGQTV